MEQVILVTIVVVLLAFHLITEAIDRRREREQRTRELTGIVEKMRAQEREREMWEVGSVSR
jgi:hypothetical protein